MDLTQRPFKYWTEGEEEEGDFMTADTYVFLICNKVWRLTTQYHPRYRCFCQATVPSRRGRLLAVWYLGLCRL